MKKGTKILLLLFFVISIFGVRYFSYAETQITIQEDEILVDLSPRNPEPYQNTTIELSSYSTDLNKAIITWQDKTGTILSGIGKTKYSFTTSGPNTTMTFNISIKPIGSVSSINKKISISPSDIELFWESIDGYAPPFYKGKVLTTKAGIIKAVAIPNTNTIKAGIGDVSYTWKNNEEVIQDASGYNKNTYIFKNNVYSNNNQITVNASSVNDNYSAEKTINVPAFSPRVIFYKRSPTEGVLYNKAINSNTFLSEDEITIVAEPYYLGIKNNENKFIYSWKINGSPIETPTKKTELTIRPTSRGGYANISIMFENTTKLFQEVAGTLKLSL